MKKADDNDATALNEQITDVFEHHVQVSFDNKCYLNTSNIDLQKIFTTAETFVQRLITYTLISTILVFFVCLFFTFSKLFYIWVHLVIFLAFIKKADKYMQLLFCLYICFIVKTVS